ncbi:MAG: hypothetical protein CVU88_02185 [Firmicutes bacterium HGW-Firmicutes-13]|nr:MAG: hypothetical protein CVU88_02185 [Firmicutes bacterium HGW-Firmicutes-13]
MISAELVKDTNLIEVKVTNTEPEKAVLIADTLTKEFLSFISEKNKERMSQSVEVLKEQIAVIEQDLLIANDILKDFNRQPRSINFVQEELNSKMNDLTMYQSELIKSDIELDQLWAGKYQLEDSLAQVDSVLLKVTTEEKGMDPETGERVVVTTTTEEPNPEYQNLLAKYENKKQEIAQLEAKITGITAAVDALVQNLGELQTELTEKKSEFTAIMRDVERLEKSHSLFSERLAQTQIYESINIGETNLLIVAPALEPTSPFKPNKKLNIAIAFVLALMVGVFLAFILEFFDDNIKNAEDVKRYLDLPVMGSIPKIDSSVKTRRVY